ncbi:MAG: hypothetical protein Ct9H300mP32_6260 [Verrucomicrobiota bacterium]|nr:MAG: hypothetical protein Ct9H300mP32_6260 [Verrucomicrobiota bacterium]
MDRKNVAVDCVATGVPLGILQHLHLNATMKRLPARRDIVRPDKNPGVAPWFMCRHSTSIMKFWYIPTVRNSQLVHRGKDHTSRPTKWERGGVHRHPAPEIFALNKGETLSRRKKQTQPTTKQRQQDKRSSFLETHDE